MQQQHGRCTAVGAKSHPSSAPCIHPFVPLVGSAQHMQSDPTQLVALCAPRPAPRNLCVMHMAVSQRLVNHIRLQHRGSAGCFLPALWLGRRPQCPCWLLFQDQGCVLLLSFFQHFPTTKPNLVYDQLVRKWRVCVLRTVSERWKGKLKRWLCIYALKKKTQHRLLWKAGTACVVSL